MLNPILISTTPTEAKAGHIVIAYNWRSTDKRVVPDSQKHRSILVPESLVADESVALVPSTYRPMVVDALVEIARARLADYCESSSMMATAISADLFAAPALMAWNADRIALQQRLTADEIKAWLPTSKTVAFATATHGDAVGKAVGEQLVKVAGPNHGMTPAKATNFLTRLWQAADADSITGLRLQLRLQVIAEGKSTDDVLAAVLGE